MIVVHIIIGLNIGGAELMLKRLVLEGSSDTTIKHIVISLGELGPIGSSLRREGLTVYALGMKSVNHVPLTILKLRKLLKEIQPDVVQTWMYHADFIGGLVAKSLGINRIVWGIRTTDVTQGNSQLTVKLSKICSKLSYYIPDKIICAAETSKKHHISIGYDESKVIVIPNGYNINDLISTNEDGLEVRKQFNLSSEDIVIGSVGRYNPVKNQRLFVEVASNLTKQLPNLKFMMVGRGNTIENKELFELISRCGLVDNFRLLGERNDIPSCLKAMDIFCLHSKTEGFPNVLVEALAAGTSCISVDVGDARQILGQYGTLVSEYNSKSIATAIHAKIVQIDRSKLQSNHSLKYVKDNYSIEKIYANFSEIWKI